MTTPKREDSDWGEFNGELLIEQKMIDKLNERAKQLKVENSNLQQRLDEK